LDKFNTAVVGWLWLPTKVNLSILLVQEGLAELHISALKCRFYREFRTALDEAQSAKKRIWSLTENENKIIASTDETELAKSLKRTIDLYEVYITEVTKQFTFFAQSASHLEDIEVLSSSLQNMPCAASPTKYIPKKGDVCASIFDIDKKWYRCRIENIKDHMAKVFYIDYGNTEIVPVQKLRKLPPGLEIVPAYAKEFRLALVELPSDPDDQLETLKTFTTDVLNQRVLMNMEINHTDQPPEVTIYTPGRLLDIAKMMIADGLIMVKRTTEIKLQPLLNEYHRMEENAFHSRLGIWKYGDIKEDSDAEEFSY